MWKIQIKESFFHINMVLSFLNWKLLWNFLSMTIAPICLLLEILEWYTVGYFLIHKIETEFELDPSNGLNAFEYKSNKITTLRNG